MSNQYVFSPESGLGIALLFIAFWGEPDLVDVLIELVQRM